MAKTLLQLVQGVQRKLRSDPAGALVAGQLETDSIVDLINDAKDEVLHERTWDFDIKTNEAARFPGRLDPASTMHNASPTVLLATLTGPGGELEDLLGTGINRTQPIIAVRVVNDTQHPEHSYRVTGFETFVGTSRFAYIQNNAYFGDDFVGDADLIFHCSGIVLPTFVRRVLSVRHLNDPLRLEFVEKHVHFDEVVPRATDSFSTSPRWAIVGGSGTSTDDISNVVTTLTPITGTIMRIWPLAETEIVVQYDYVHRHANLSVSSPTATLTAVPEPVENLIEWVAFQLALLSNMEADPVRFEATRRKVDARIARLYAQHRPDPLRRDEARPWDRPHKSRDPRWRWDSQSITAPS